MKENSWKPNQSGTFNNRTSIHKDDEKKFVIEFYTESIEERQEIIKRIIEALNNI